MEHDMAVKKVIDNIRSGWYTGRGYKAASREDYETALNYYKMAIQCSKEKNDVVLHDSMAIVLYKLGKHKDALYYARRCLKIYQELELTDPISLKRIYNIEVLIEHLEDSVGNTLHKVVSSAC